MWEGLRHYISENNVVTRLADNRINAFVERIHRQTGRYDWSSQDSKVEKVNALNVLNCNDDLSKWSLWMTPILEYSFKKEKYVGSFLV